MTEKEKYVMGRADYLHDAEGLSLTEGCEIAEREFDGLNDAFEDDFQNFRARALNESKKAEEAVMTKWLNELGYKDPVGYYRNYSSMQLEIYTTRPGVLIGRAGVGVDKLKKLMAEEFYGEWGVKFIEIRGGFVNVLNDEQTIHRPGMKLKDVLSVIGGATPIMIFDGPDNIFSGKMCDVKKSQWDTYMSQRMDYNVIRLNTKDGSITIGI